MIYMCVPTSFCLQMLVRLANPHANKISSVLEAQTGATISQLSVFYSRCSQSVGLACFGSVREEKRNCVGLQNLFL